MKPYSRGMHFDFHTMPGIENMLADFDVDSFAKTLSDCHVEFINFPARCNIGFSYYNTKLGTKYPTLKADLLGDVISACHKYGIGVSAYINGGLNHELASKRPELCRINKNGTVCSDDTKDNFFRTMCFNRGYDEYLLSEICEILEYDVDGIFVDCMLPKPCYCPECLRKMARKGIDTNDDAAVLAYQQEVILDMYKRIKALIKKDIYLYINSNVTLTDIHTHAEVECLPSSKLWGCDYFYPVSSFHRTHFKKRVYMTGRFQDCWGDFGGIKTTEALQNDLYDAMLSAYDFTISDHLHPIYGLFDEVAKRVKSVFEEKIKYEPYMLNSEYISEIGVLVCKDDYTAKDYLIGVARMLTELKLPYSTYNPCDNYASQKLLIIPKKLSLSEKEKTNLISFSKNGGKILFVGDAIDNAVELNLNDGINCIGSDTFDNAYFQTENGGMLWSMYNPARIIKCDGGREIARYVSGLFNFTFDGRHSYFYRPQGNPTEYSAAVTTANNAYICYDAFLAYASNFLKENKLLVKRCIDSLLPDRLLEFEGLPSSAVVSLTRNEKHTVLHIKVTAPTIRNGRGIIEEHSLVKNVRASVKGNYRILNICKNEPVTSYIENGRTNFVCDDILGYCAFELIEY